MPSDLDLRLTALRLAGGEGRRLRERAGLTQREVAEATGVTTGCVQNWEAGRRTPRGDGALRYGRLLRRLRRAAR